MKINEIEESSHKDSHFKKIAIKKKPCLVLEDID